MKSIEIPAWFGRLHRTRIRALEKQIGYRLLFPKVAPGWIQGCAAVDLTKNWRRFGLDATGVDYFTMGALGNGISTRFDPSAYQFQSWMGGYLVKVEGPTTNALQDSLDLAVVDQLDWLGHYGDPRPLCDLKASGFKHAGTVQVGRHEGQLYVGGGLSHADIGSGNERVWLQLAARFVAMAFNQNGNGFPLTSPNFVPIAGQPSYPEVFLKGYVICIELETDVRVVLYGNGTVHRDSKGREIDTFELIKGSLLDTLTGVVIIRE
jgi:hypothetical protein